MEPYTRMPRGYREEGWWAGQDLVTRVLACVLIDSAAWRTVEKWDCGALVRLTPGQSLWSLSELAREVSTTERRVEGARDRLLLVGFCEFSRAHGAPKAKSVFTIRQWWRFVDPGRETVPENEELAVTQRVKNKPLQTKENPELSDKRCDTEVTQRGHNGDTEPRESRGRTDRAQSTQRKSAAARVAPRNGTAKNPPSRLASPLTEGRGRVLRPAGQSAEEGPMVVVTPEDFGPEGPDAWLERNYLGGMFDPPEQEGEDTADGA